MSDTRLNPGDMSPDELYLWDASGTPSATTLEIESALRPLRYSGSPLRLSSHRTIVRRWPLMAVAATVLLGVCLAVYFNSSPARKPVPIPTYAGWTIKSITGDAGITGADIGIQTVSATHITTSADAAVAFDYHQQTDVLIAGSSEARLSSSSSVELISGKTTVVVTAGCPPVAVTTPSMTCTLAPGCAATIEYNGGSSKVVVKSGWAEVHGGNETLRLSDAMGCQSQPKSGEIWPPYRLVADSDSAVLTKQIEDVLYSDGKIDAKTQYSILAKALERTKPTDAVLLWNLLSRVQEHQRAPIRNRLATLVKQPPAGKAFDGVLALDKDALDAWWQAILKQ